MNIRETFKDLFYDKEGNYQDLVDEGIIKLAKENGLFKLFLPAALGGKNLDLSQTLTVFRETAYCNGSFGWLIQIGNGGNYFVTNCTDATNQTFFSCSNSLLTGSAMTGGIAIADEDGFRISGEWKYASGSEFATVFTATVRDEKTNEIFTGLIPRNQVEIIRDWETLGMRQTCSHSFRVQDVYVPREHTFQTMQRINYLDESIFGLPFFIYAQVFFSATLYGIIERMIEEGNKIKQGKEAIWQTYLPQRLLVVDRLSETALNWLKNQDELMDVLLESIAEGKEVDEVRWSNELKENAQQIKSWAHEWFSCFGMDVLQEKHVLNIFYRDLITLTQHGLFQI